MNGIFMKIWLPALVIVASVGTLITAGVIYGHIPEMQVHEVIEDPPLAEQKIKVHGILHSVQQVDPGLDLEFILRDKKSPGLLLSIVTDEIRPEIFEVGKDVAVEGYFNPEKRRLDGTKIYTKCPSKYEESKEQQ